MGGAGAAQAGAHGRAHHTEAEGGRHGVSRLWTGCRSGGRRGKGRKGALVGASRALLRSQHDGHRRALPSHRSLQHSTSCGQTAGRPSWLSEPPTGLCPPLASPSANGGLCSSQGRRSAAASGPAARQAACGSSGGGGTSTWRRRRAPPAAGHAAAAPAGPAAPSRLCRGITGHDSSGGAGAGSWRGQGGAV